MLDFSDAYFLSTYIKLSSFKAWVKEESLKPGFKVSSLSLNYFLIQNTPKGQVLTGEWMQGSVSPGNFFCELQLQTSKSGSFIVLFS